MKNDARKPSGSTFQGWYKDLSKKTGVSSNPDDPRHHYDYRAAYKAGAKPDKTGHMPSAFKKDSHPNLVIKGVNTKTGKKVGKK